MNNNIDYIVYHLYANEMRELVIWIENATLVERKKQYQEAEPHTKAFAKSRSEIGDSVERLALCFNLMQFFAVNHEYESKHIFVHYKYARSFYIQTHFGLGEQLTCELKKAKVSSGCHENKRIKQHYYSILTPNIARIVIYLIETLASGRSETKKGPIGRWDFDTQEEYSDYMSTKEALPKAAFQYGKKLQDGRKTRKHKTDKNEKAELDRE
uniref:Protein RED C-terminal domain-containing protein n=1 Tax=Glossina palpalis gambiensis TaxID=67801 RepID=A0A1B0B363_9MUSC